MRFTYPMAGYYLLYLPSTASHTIKSTMAAPKAIGSTWLFRYRGKEWPVVLSDDDTPPNAFIKGRPNPFLCPAILLGKHML